MAAETTQEVVPWGLQTGLLLSVRCPSCGAAAGLPARNKAPPFTWSSERLHKDCSLMAPLSGLHTLSSRAQTGTHKQGHTLQSTSQHSGHERAFRKLTTGFQQKREATTVKVNMEQIATNMKQHHRFMSHPSDTSEGGNHLHTASYLGSSRYVRDLRNTQIQPIQLIESRNWKYLCPVPLLISVSHTREE